MAYTQNKEKAAANGTVLFYHGLFFHKDGHHKELSSLAQAGYLAIGVDAIGHGERARSDLKEWLGVKELFENRFIELVSQTAHEVPHILDALLNLSLVDDVRVAMMGVSFGAYITYLTVLEEKRIVAAIPLLGNPEWPQHPNSPHLRPEEFYPVALLSQTAGLDTSVPPLSARNLHENLRPHYSITPERLRYVEYRYSGHFMREEDWNTAWRISMDWLKKFL